jgi:hypothetical protein
MAKRKQIPSQENDAAASTPPQPKTRRSRAATAGGPETIASYPGVEVIEERPNPTLASAHDRSGSMSMSSEPSDEDIRMRAYQRYLERGGRDGMDFQDWLEAERELKPSR